MNTFHDNRQLPISLFRVAQDKQSYTNILYLLVSFPLGLAYFVFLVSGIAVGIGTLVIWVGALILIVMMNTWPQVAAFERHMAIQWLHVDIPPLSYPSSIQMSRWQRVQIQLRNSMTWKTLVYLLLKFPLGLFSFVITVALLPLSVAVTIVTLIIGLLTAPFYTLILVLQGASDARQRLQHYLLLAFAGFGLSFATLYLLNGLAFIAGQFARLMLGMSDTAWRLEEARALAAQERARAEQAEQRRHELIVNVSHELRTPVASISGHIESLLMATKEGTTTPSPEALYNYLGIALDEVERLGMLVD